MCCEFTEICMKMDNIIKLICLIVILEIDSRDVVANTLSEKHHVMKRSVKTCHDRYAVIPGHTMCLSQRKNNPFNATIRQAIVDKHNEFRSKVVPPASNMMKMSYSEILEEESQIWAEQCKMTHDHGIERFQPGLFHVGQNIASSQSEIPWDEVIQLWYDEYKKFTYGSNKYNFLDIGHYTQVVWANTALVGCGVNKCGDTFYYVCNYGPGGNSGHIELPYKNGSACADCSQQCDSTGKLCDCGDKVCLNDGVLNLATCECQCNNNVKRFDKNNCELYCEKDGDHPLCGIPPFDKKSCATNSAATMNCPWLCDVCPYAGSNYTDGDVPLPSSIATTVEWNLFSTIFFTVYVVLMNN